MLDYGLGALCGAVLGFGAAFFAQGGLLDRRLFLRLCRMPGRWHRQRWLLAGLGALLGVYIVWVQEGFGRGAAGLLPWSPGWVMIPLSLLIDAAIAAALIIRNKKIAREVAEHWNED